METTTHHTAVVIQQPPVAIAANPKLLGSVHGVRDWSAGLCSYCVDCKASELCKQWCFVYNFFRSILALYKCSAIFAFACTGTRTAGTYTCTCINAGTHTVYCLLFSAIRFLLLCFVYGIIGFSYSYESLRIRGHMLT